MHHTFTAHGKWKLLIREIIANKHSDDCIIIGAHELYCSTEIQPQHQIRPVSCHRRPSAKEVKILGNCIYLKRTKHHLN
jgi:hypothetical protein